MKGGASGGTVASMKATIDDARHDGQLAKLLADPYALSPDRDAEPRLGAEGDLRGVRHDRELGQWVGPFIMGAINTRVVRRSNALQGWAYGARFRYQEVMGLGSGPLAAVQAGALAGGVGALTAGLSIGPARALLDRVLPSPGEGPSESQRERGFFRIEIHTRTSSGARYALPRGRPGRSGLQGDVGDARGEQPVSRVGRGQPAGARRRADARDSDGRRARSAAAARRADLDVERTG